MSVIDFTTDNCKSVPVLSTDRKTACKQDPVKPVTKAPIAEVSLCRDPLFEVIRDPNNPRVIASLFNECCDPFTNEDGEVITLVIDGINPLAKKGVC